MDGERRRAAVEALTALGRSGDWSDRAVAGHSLAGFAEMPEAVGPVRELVLDADNTYVTLRTAEGLLARKDRAGLAIVASAWMSANDQQVNWICTAIDYELTVFSDDRDKALALFEELSEDADEQVAEGAREFLELLSEIKPFLGAV